MRNVCCALCGEKLIRETLLSARGIPINKIFAIEIGISLRGNGEVCNKCRTLIIDFGEKCLQKIKEGFENGKDDEKES